MVCFCYTFLRDEASLFVPITMSSFEALFSQKKPRIRGPLSGFLYASVGSTPNINKIAYSRFLVGLSPNAVLTLQRLVNLLTKVSTSCGTQTKALSLVLTLDSLSNNIRRQLANNYLAANSSELYDLSRPLLAACTP